MDKQARRRSIFLFCSGLTAGTLAPDSGQSGFYPPKIAGCESRGRPRNFAGKGGSHLLPESSGRDRKTMAEAIRKIEVKDFPVIVVIDREGNNLYETAIRQYHTLEEM